MWLYFYLLTAPFYDVMGFHTWGYTTQHPFPFDQMKTNLISSYPDVYYKAIYQLPITNQTKISFNKMIRPPNYYLVRGETGVAWYKISIQHIESIFTNSSISSTKIYPEKVWLHNDFEL